jgi:hypothetical protein
MASKLRAFAGIGSGPGRLIGSDDLPHPTVKKRVKYVAITVK